MSRPPFAGSKRGRALSSRAPLHPRRLSCARHCHVCRSRAVVRSRRRLFSALVATSVVSGCALADEEGKVTLIDRTAASKLTGYAKQALEYNQRIQRQNSAPPEFPTFIRDKFDITVVADGYQTTTEGLYYKDFKVGSGKRPSDGEQVTFAYTAYNESGGLIDSTYRQGREAQTQLGISALIPGFELGIKTMMPGGQRRIVVPPALGPPVGPSTFFSAKQCEIFDVELIDIQPCKREGVLMFSRVVCGY